MAREQKDFSFIRKGVLVHWQDPGIIEYPEDERDAQLNKVWEIADCPGANDMEDDDIILIVSAEGDGSEAEVCPTEIYPAEI